jgi:hypothetical protein
MEKPLEQILLDNNPEELRVLFSFDRNDSVDLIALKFALWARRLFPKFFAHKDEPVEDAEFHEKIDKNNIMVYIGLAKTFLNIAYRGAAKTTRSKLLKAFLISNDRDHTRRYMKILSEDGTNSKQSVTDIYNILIDPKMTKIYPEIFEKTHEKREETMSSFTTAQGVKLRAGTINQSQRGAIQDEARPDFIWFDDFETRITLKSAVKTYTIWLNMVEAYDGLSIDGGAIYTCNYLSERGNVHKLVNRADNIKHLILITPIYKNGVVSWPARYTLAEAMEIVAKAEDGAGEYLCEPSKSKDILFDRAKIDAMKPAAPLRDVGGFRMYKTYDPSKRYAGGQDVAGGVGLDSSTSVFINFDVFPAEVVGTFDSNEILPMDFGDEIKREAEYFGECLVAPEKNNHGHATIGRLKQIYDTEKIYRTMPDDDKIDRNGKRPLPEYGWETNSVTKSKMVSAFVKAVNDGHVILNDPKLIAECRSYTRNDLMDNEVDARLTTNHWDLLIAACIAWQMKDFAVVAPVPVEEIVEEERTAYSDIGF